jgi:mxaD protein
MSKSAPIIAFLTLLWSASALAHGPVRQKVEEKVTINAPAEKVWEAIRDLCSIKTWHPKVKDCTLEGEQNTKRKLSLADGGWIVETLKQHDEKKRLISFKFNFDDVSAAKTIVYAGQEIQVPVLPVANYSDSLEVKQQGEKTEVIWKGAFYRAYMNNNPPPEMNEDAAVRAVSEFYRSGLDKLKQVVEKP